ncbi:unnamed protein product [Caenorhabditis brenneri]
MHISLISFVALLFVYIVNPVYHPIQIGILTLNLYSIYHSYLTYCIVFIQLGFSQKCCNILLSFMFFLFLRAAFYATVIVILKESTGDILEFDLLETGLLLVNIVTLVSVAARWKWKINQFKDPNINQISASNFVNSTVTIGFCLLFHLLTLFKFSVNFKSTFPLTSDKLISNIYYLPFLWILSSIITHLPPIQAWIKKYDVGEEPGVPELQMTQISVENNLEVRGVTAGTEDSSVPYSTLEEINISA